MKKIYLALLTLLLTGITYAQDVTFTAEAPQTVIQGEQFAFCTNGWTKIHAGRGFL